MTRILCGVFTVALAGQCLAEAPAKAARPVSQDLVKEYSPSANPNRRSPVAGLTPGAGYRNGYPNGSCCTCCGPGTQYLGCGCSVQLDLSNGVGLCDPCTRSYCGCYDTPRCGGVCW